MVPPDGLARRTFLLSGASLVAALAVEGLWGRTQRAFAAAPWLRMGPDEPDPPNEIVARILKTRFGDRPITRGHVTLDMPDSAEDGRVVPVTIESDLPMTAERYVNGVYLVVDHNPDPLLTVFHLTPAIGPVAISIRIKMKRTSWIRAIVETNTGELWADYRKVATTLNGCG